MNDMNDMNDMIITATELLRGAISVYEQPRASAHQEVSWGRQSVCQIDIFRRVPVTPWWLQFVATLPLS